MFREKIPARQLSAWLFTAMVPGGLQLLCGGSWLWVGIAGLFSVAMARILWRNPREVSKWESAPLFIYISLLVGTLLPLVAGAWPVGNSGAAVPLILLILSAWAAQKGPRAAAGVGATLFWVVLGLYLVVFAAGVENVKLSWLRPQWNLPDEAGLTVLLLPWSATALLQERSSPGKRGWGIPVFLTVGAMLTAGVLSPEMASRDSNAFYEMSRSLDLLGVARRFEALISAGTTVGWFACLSLWLTLCGQYAQKIFPGADRPGIWLAAGMAGVWMLCGLHISGWITLIFGAVFWGALPLITQGLEKRKKM